MATKISSNIVHSGINKPAKHLRQYIVALTVRCVDGTRYFIGTCDDVHQFCLSSMDWFTTDPLGSPCQFGVIHTMWRNDSAAAFARVVGAYACLYGYEFVCIPRVDWPIKKLFKTQDLPQRIMF